MQNLFASTLKGLTWSSIGTFTKAFLQIGYSAVMARLLSPADFGLMAMCMMAITFGDYFSRMGMAHAIIQKVELSENEVRSAFSTSFALGLLFSALMFFTAPIVGAAFSVPEIEPLIRILSVAFLFNGFAVTSSGLLRRNLEFKAMAMIEISSYLICYFGIAMYLALNDYGVFSLVYAYLAQQFYTAALYYLATRHSLKPFYHWGTYKPLFAFGSKISFIGLLEFTSQYVDTFIIARILGASKLGIYNRAFTIIQLPAYYLTSSLTNVIFPVFSKVQTDLNKFQKAYLTSYTLMSALLFPICFGVAAASKEVVLILLGKNWEEAIPILTILSIATPFKLLSFFGKIVCDATANLKWKIILEVVFLVAITAMFFAFNKYGLVAFALIVLVFELLKNIAYSFIVKDLLNLSLTTTLFVYYPGIFNAILAYAGIYIVTTLLHLTNIHVLILFFIQFLTGSMIFLMFTLLFPRHALKIALTDIFSKLTFDNPTTVALLCRLNWYREFQRS